MAKSTALLRQYILPRQSHRQISGSSGRRASSSPQRKAAANPAVASTAVKPFTEIPGPLALPMLKHSAYVLPRIGSFHHSVGLGLLEGMRDRYGDLVRLAKASRSRPVLYVFDPEMMREVRRLVFSSTGSFHHSVGLGLLEGMRDRYGDLVRLAKASRSRPVLYVFDPEMMREVRRLVFSSTGSFHHSVGLGLLEGMRDRYGDLVRLAKASRSRPVLYVFDPEMMREVRHLVFTSTCSFHHSVGLGLLEGMRDRYGDLVRLAKASRSRPVLYVFDPEMMREVRPLISSSTCSFYHSVGVGLLKGMWDRYGDLVRLAKASRSRPVLYVFDPEMMREVYESGVTEPPRWENSPLSHHRKSVPETCPIHNDESKTVWLAIRALLQDGTLLKNYSKTFDNIATDATRRLGDLRHSENALNEELETEIYRWALETVAMMVLGIRLGCLDGPVHIPTADNRKPEKTSMDDDSPDLCSLSSRDLEGLTPAEQLVRCTRDIADGNFLVRSEDTLVKDSPIFGRALQTFDKHYSLTEHFLKQAMEEINSTNVREEHVLLDRLRPLGSRILPLASDLLLAGVDPLAQTAISMFYHMSLHAAQQQRAHDEVHWAAASIDAGAGCPEMPYIAACAMEAMRLHPATGGVVRRSKEELEVAGYNVPAGVDIVLAHGVTSKLEKQWGRPKAFIPERWCSEGWEPLRASKAHPLASLPFGETCPATGVVGQMLAALATRVLDKYRLEWHGPAPNMATTGVNRLQPPYFFVLQNAA
ncbi:hypothetical protein O0L34_g5861 [Tuta absoluta]|nr:hypothetical protein O0L34_g5861 [Tuta absoluta]